MLTLREKLMGLRAPKKFQIPKKSKFLGTITEDGFCDYEVPEDNWYVEKDKKKADRLMRSTRARKHRKFIRELYK